MRLIVDLQMEEIRERLAEHDLNVQISPEARDWLADVGYDPDFGARPLRRALQKYVESPLSISLLAGQFSPGDTILVNIEETGKDLEFQTIKTEVPAENIQPVEAQT
jgi:ATP-dependent Clp protease ATP-binding subunit ClpC